MQDYSITLTHKQIVENQEAAAQDLEKLAEQFEAEGLPSRAEIARDAAQKIRDAKEEG